MTEQTTLRQDHIDCVQGLMILCVMLYHLYDLTYKPLYYILLFPLSFRIAWFFFKGGMFYKERGFKDVLFSGFKKLVVPAVVFNIIGFICYIVVEKPQINIINEIDFLYVFGSLHGDTPLWFLLSFFAIQIIYSLLRKMKISPIIIAFFSIGLFYTNKIIGFRPYWAYNIPIGLLFYALGSFFKEIQYKKNVIIISIIIYSSLLLVNKELYFYFAKFHPFLVAIPWALAGCILINVLFKSFPIIGIKPLKLLGQYSMEFYCTHFIIINLIEAYIRNNTLPISDMAFRSIAFAIYIIVLFVTLHFFKLSHIQWIFGKTPKKSVKVESSGAK